MENTGGGGRATWLQTAPSGSYGKIEEKEGGDLPDTSQGGKERWTDWGYVSEERSSLMDQMRGCEEQRNQR